jgi:uncharacterized protein
MVGDGRATAAHHSSGSFAQFADGSGELLVCPICFNSCKLEESQLVGNAKIVGASPLHDWIGEGATVFSY